MTEDQRLEIVRDLQEDHPDLDWENLLAGSLAGPASTDRPDMPVWEYRSFVVRTTRRSA